MTAHAAVSGPKRSTNHAVPMLNPTAPADPHGGTNGSRMSS
jgi:hypothetical protein